MYTNDIHTEIEVESAQDKCCQTAFNFPKTKDQTVQTDGQVIIMEESVQTTAQQVGHVLIDKSSGMASQIVMIDKCIGAEGYESTQQAKELLQNNFTQTVSIPSSVTDQCIQEHAGSEANLQIERSRGRNSSGEYIPESSTNSECDVSEVFNS